MTLIAIASPQSESDLSVMLCTLEAHGIPAFVQGNGFGSLFPGPQIAAYNARRVMVPEEYAPEARKALESFSQPSDRTIPHTPGLLNKLRVIFECFIFGWFIPGHRYRDKNTSD